MPWTNDTKPTPGSYTGDHNPQIARWDDALVTWDSALFDWDSGTVFMTQDAKPTPGAYTNDLKPA